jgi:glutathione peroxidase
MSIYNFSVKSMDGQEVSLEKYKGKVLIIVNTASKCGFTPQYEDLQRIYERYGKDGLEILAFPCNQFMNQEPGTDEEIASFCNLNFGITFPVFAKVDVNGPTAHPLYQYLQENSPGILGKSIKWNFTKFLVDSKGIITGRFSPATSPAKLEKQIKLLIKEVVE